jgi:iron-sulfur cluster repair protein YtfE (RIC family)
VARVLVEHVDLRRRGQDVAASADADPAELRELGERLEQHIRHEERVLFPLIEEALPAEELARVARETGHVT